ncbi:MAG: DUF1934 domain-containing protein [Mogibacterium sp.]|nr:DUF1934 domain-containing protein [Mogibacterium sp.]MBR3331790.1 DUF1934 domain-containing protein [Mogibacterium sp.]MBR4090834.1 DUF1934 domain-containing protein [Mogibacterium sp.]MBR6678407.1 DUF1934 domain-containing protein [Oscillospiraceae bacterium]
MKKSVNLKITSQQYIENLKPSGEAFRRELELEDSMEILTEGTVYSRNNATYITYEESEAIGSEDIRTLFKLEDGSIRIRKYVKDEDDEGMDMTLKPGMLNITRYQIPKMSSVNLEVYTNKLEDNLDENGYGKISVDYKIKFDRFFSRRNILEIEVMPS